MFYAALTLSQVFVQRNMKCRNWVGFFRQWLAIDFSFVEAM
jgi:hypothetical protein